MLGGCQLGVSNVGIHRQGMGLKSLPHLAVGLEAYHPWLNCCPCRAGLRRSSSPSG
jgi:hypothetical protein